MSFTAIPYEDGIRRLKEEPFEKWILIHSQSWKQDVLWERAWG